MDHSQAYKEGGGRLRETDGGGQEQCPQSRDHLHKKMQSFGVGQEHVAALPEAKGNVPRKSYQ